MTEKKQYDLSQVSEYEWKLPRTGDMIVPGKLFLDPQSAEDVMKAAKGGEEWNSLDQLRNVASLPGIVKSVIGMADMHPGYGFPIGGIGAFDLQEGVVAAGGVGFDINCGVRLLNTPLTEDEFEGKKERVARSLFQDIPAGLGSEGQLSLSLEEIDQALVEGAEFAIKRGFGLEEDLEKIEEGGRLKGADPTQVSRRAKQRQFKQIGTLGSGNHYLEVQRVADIFDGEAAKAFGLFPDQIVIAIHTGSRALGHQIGQDYLQKLGEASKKYGIPIREKELVCAPIDSPEGRNYIGAMQAGINCAFANRQTLAGLVRRSLEKTLNLPAHRIKTTYEVGHNTAKFETHKVDGEKRELLVHRKGSTRAFGPGHERLPKDYREVGQPVLVGGTMGTSSFILKGSEKGMKETFGSGIHGAGRSMSRKKAKRKFWGETVAEEMKAKGIVLKAHSMPGVAEEAPGAYKQVERVIQAAEGSGITPQVAQLKPLVVIKG
ncbi:MAG: RtcB family protein [Candidatus Acetothermia bacterium]